MPISALSSGAALTTADMQDDSNARRLSRLFYNPLALASAKD
jgi:hypothetical protein